VKEIRVYVEGGGNNNTSRRRIRGGFSSFLDPLRELARQKRLGWNVIVCGPRSEAFESFKMAAGSHPEAFNVLLVDSESPVSRPAWEHLQRQDGWTRPESARESQSHLMVQAVEAWIVADLETLSGFYGKGFLRNALPGADDVEVISKDRLLSSLNHATRSTQKGPYHKIDHGAALLERIDPGRVRARSKHCDRLFREIEAAIREA